MKTQDIDDIFQRWEKNNSTNDTHYGFFVNGKLITVGKKRVYRRAGDLKNALYKSLGIYAWKYSNRSSQDNDNRSDMRKHVEDLLKRGIIEIKQI